MAHRALRVLTPDYLSGSFLSPPSSHTLSSNHTWTHHSRPHRRPPPTAVVSSSGSGVTTGLQPKSDTVESPWPPLSPTAPPLLSPSPAPSLPPHCIFKLVYFYPHCHHPCWHSGQLPTGLRQHCDSFVADLRSVSVSTNPFSAARVTFLKGSLIICLPFLEFFHNLVLTSFRKPFCCSHNNYIPCIRVMSMLVGFLH